MTKSYPHTHYPYTHLYTNRRQSDSHLPPTVEKFSQNSMYVCKRGNDDHQRMLHTISTYSRSNPNIQVGFCFYLQTTALNLAQHPIKPSPLYNKFETAAILAWISSHDFTSWKKKSEQEQPYRRPIMRSIF